MAEGLRSEEKSMHVFQPQKSSKDEKEMKNRSQGFNKPGRTEPDIDELKRECDSLQLFLSVNFFYKKRS